MMMGVYILYFLVILVVNNSGKLVLPLILRCNPPPRASACYCCTLTVSPCFEEGKQRKYPSLLSFASKMLTIKVPLKLENDVTSFS